MRYNSITIKALLVFMFVILSLPAWSDILQNAFSNCSLTLHEVCIDNNDLVFRGENTVHVIPLLDACREKPFRLGRYCRVTAGTLRDNAASLRAMMSIAALRTGYGQLRGFLANPIDDWTLGKLDYEALDRELVKMSAKYNGKWVTRYIKTVEKDWEKVPAEVLESVIIFLRSLDSALQWRDKAFRNIPPGDREALFRQYVTEFSILSEVEDKTGEVKKHLSDEIAGTIDLLNSIDWRMLFTGALELSIALEHIGKKLSEVKFGDNKFYATLDTPLGFISIGGTGENFFPDDVTHLLIIDIGGNDNYRGGGASSSYAMPVGAILDLSGDDIYFCELPNRPSFGSGVFGYGFTYDLAGNDYYKASAISQGSGLFGAGGLWDGAGNDTYAIVRFGQAAGYFGLGLLADIEGNDKYSAYHTSQAFAGPIAAAVLLDMKGADSYAAIDTDIRFPSPQTKEHNASLCQGAAFGRRADYLEGHSLGGGFAILADMEGDDIYTAGVFAQGTGYWGGVGMLYDGAGSDNYRAAWYVIGATAHFAAAAFVDESGDDRYEGLMNMAIGAAHDYSVSFFLDSKGNDTYIAPNLSLGAGNANAVGIFIDRAGDDTYTAKGRTLGSAAIDATSTAMSRYFSLSLGIFIDAGGTDSYPKEGFSAKTLAPANGFTWLHKRGDKASPSEKGIGIDTDEWIDIPE